jgi:CRISPR-associated protein (TIGR03984 family)
MDGENLALSGGVYPEISPALEPLTLQELRLFGKDAELLVWRAQGGLQARALREVAGEGVKYRQYDLLLWGAAAGAPKDGFQLMEEGAQGLRHAPPARAARARLKARDYLAHDEKTGQAYICCSRLVLLEEGGA